MSPRHGRSFRYFTGAAVGVAPVIFLVAFAAMLAAFVVALAHVAGIV